MKRPKSASERSAVRSGMAQLPGVGQFTLSPSAHHPLCPSADDRTTTIRNTASNETSAYYPLSTDALRAIDAIEYITEHLKRDEQHKSVSFFVNISPKKDINF